MNTLHRIARLLPVVLVGLGAVAIGVPTSQGGDPFVAGGRSTRPVDLPPSAADQANMRARHLATALGLPGVTQRVERLEDRFEHRTYDEVTSFDSAGREVAIARFETDGTVAMAVALGWHPGGGSPVDRATAETRGQALARAAGLDVRGRPTVMASTGSGGWSVGWPRVVDGVAVRGDGVRLALWPDGTFHGLNRIERPLAPAPAQPMTSAAARSAAETWARAQYGSAAPDLRLGTVERAWVAPNDAFAANGPDAPAETLRLAWVVRFDAVGTLADRVRQIEVWIDAGDGTLLGGDVVE
jgi:hypothetical protein